MKRPVVCLLGVALMTSLWTFRQSHAQETITNVSQLAQQLSKRDWLYSPVLPWECQVYPTDGQPWWTDFSQFPNEFSPPATVALPEAYGVKLLPLRLTCDLLTGETIVRAEWSGEAIACIAPPADYQPGEAAAQDEIVLRMWQQWKQDAEEWEGGIDPFTLVLLVQLADINDKPVYDANVAAEEAAWEEAQAAEQELGSPSESEDGGGGVLARRSLGEGETLWMGGDSCAITNLAQSFAITSIQQDTNRYTTITWQSCPTFRYIVLSTDELSTNTVWLTQAYVWGQANAASWTDTTSTNVAHRFYKVARMLASPIAAGAAHSLALRPDGTVWAWGKNEYGQLGNGMDDRLVYTDQPFPVEVADVTSCSGQTISNAVALAGGRDFSVAADANGRVWTWGYNSYGILGNGPNTSYDQPVPSPISGVSNVVSVAAGSQHALALRTDGTVWAWGDDSYGQLGVGGLPWGTTNVPIRSLVLTQIVAIAAGQYHSVALDKNGTVWTWGAGDSGRLGNGGTTNITVPASVTGISNVIAIAAGGLHTIALTANKTVWTWGNNNLGQLGLGVDDQYETTPGQVSELSNVVAIAGGYAFTLAVTSNGQVYAWGDNGNGELGYEGDSAKSPVLVAGISNAVLVAANPNGLHCLAMTVQQGINYYWDWGLNSWGQIGNGTNEFIQYTPVSVQFCTRCQRNIQFGTSGIYTAQCTGTLHLYYNDVQGWFQDNSGSYTVTISILPTNMNVLALDSSRFSPGVAIGTVTNGGTYTYSATGWCNWDINCGTNCDTNPDGQYHNGSWVACPDMTYFACPPVRCDSLVGKIQ